MHPRPDHAHDDTMELFLADATVVSGAPYEPGAGVHEPSPVFVDTSGRRQRRVRRWGYLLVVPAVGYVALLVSALLGGPTVQAPFLPAARPPQTEAPSATPSPASDSAAPGGETASSTPRTGHSTAPGSATASPTPSATPTVHGSAPATRPAPAQTTAPATGKPTSQSPSTGKPTARPSQGGGKPTSRP